MKKHNTILIASSILVLLAVLVSGIAYLSHLLAVTTHYTYGPYECGGRKLLVKQDVVYNQIAGALKTMNISVDFGEYSFTPLVYSPASEETKSGITFVQTMSDAQKEQYRRDTTSASLDLRTDIMESVARKYRAENGRPSEDLLATTKLSEVDFLDFKKCFDVNTEDIYTNMIQKTQDKHLGTALSQYTIFRRVYNAK